MSAVQRKNVHPLLAAYLVNLAANPLRTKAITGGILSFIQEPLASHIAGVPSKRPGRDASIVSHALSVAKIDSKSLKMSAYGAFISAPMSHFLVGTLQRLFAGKTGTGAKIAQILASNLIVSPIQATVYLASMAVINGAKSVDEIIRTVKGGFLAVMRVSWLTSPLAMVIAQKFIPQELWVPFFNLVAFSIGTYFTSRLKLMKMAAEAKKEKDTKSTKST